MEVSVKLMVSRLEWNPHEGLSTRFCIAFSSRALVARGQLESLRQKHSSSLSAMFNVIHLVQLQSSTANFFLTWVNAEHSTYLTAFNSFANFSPCSNVIGFCLFFANFSNVPFSSRKSICVPTSKNGVFWQWCVISGTHWKNPEFNKIHFKGNGLIILPFPLHSRMSLD